GDPLFGLDTPTLRGAWETPPYLHDGSASTLRDVLTTSNPDGMHGHVSALLPEQVDQLVAYLLQIDGATPPRRLPFEPPAPDPAAVDETPGGEGSPPEVDEDPADADAAGSAGASDDELASDDTSSTGSGPLPSGSAPAAGAGAGGEPTSSQGASDVDDSGCSVLGKRARPLSKSWCLVLLGLLWSAVRR